MRNFTYNPQTLEYVCTDPGVNAKISITFKDQYNDILSGVARYRVSLPFCSPDLATRFETAIAGMGTRRVQAMYMGYSTISGYPFSAFVMPYTSGTSSYNSIFKMVMEPVANTPDQIAIASYETGTPPGLNTGNFVSRFSPIFNDMVSKSPYVVKGDDPDLLYAGTIQLVSVADPSFIIGLYY